MASTYALAEPQEKLFLRCAERYKKKKKKKKKNVFFNVYFVLCFRKAEATHTTKTSIIRPFGRPDFINPR
jgi:hypothetical protein